MEQHRLIILCWVKEVRHKRVYMYTVQVKITYGVKIEGSGSSWWRCKENNWNGAWWELLLLLVLCFLIWIFVKIHLAVNLGSMCLSVCVFCLYEIFILKKQHMGKYMWVQSTEVWQSEFWDQADKEGLVEEGKFWDSAEKCGWLNGDRNKCVIY